MSLLLLSAAEVTELLDPVTCLDAVEKAFRALGEGRVTPPVSCGLEREEGSLHVKAAAYEDGHAWLLAKVNANFPGNPRHHRLPTIQGAALLFDGACGVPLALLDSPSLTALRTAAATALAARLLAPGAAHTLGLIGCGVQAAAHLPALAGVLPLRHVWLYDADPVAARRLAASAAALGLEARLGRDAAEAARASDVVVCCTPGRDFVLGAGDVRPGALVAGVGADNPHKRELHPSLLAAGSVVTDLREQCARMGDLHHALDGGAMRLDEVHADLAEILVGERPGRQHDDELWIFDSTGLALQDVAAAIPVYRRALAAGRGVRTTLGG